MIRMQEELTEGKTQENLVKDELIGKDCTYCDQGTLREGVYKGNFAILCSACETPAYRTFL